MCANKKKMNKIGQKEERSGVGLFLFLFLFLFGAIVLVFGDFFGFF